MITHLYRRLFLSLYIYIYLFVINFGTKEYDLFLSMPLRRLVKLIVNFKCGIFFQDCLSAVMSFSLSLKKES